MSDEAETDGQDNTNDQSGDTTSQEGNLLTDATDTTTEADGEDNPDDKNTDGTDDQETDGESDEAEGDESTDGEDGDQKEEAPESYEDFNLPEGFEGLDDTLIAAATPIFKEIGLSQPQAQQLIDLYATTIQGQSETRSQAFTDLNNTNIKGIKDHPDYGGDKLDGSLVHVARGIDALMGKRDDEGKGQDFRELLNQTGLGNHPLMFELLTKVGQSVGEDGYTTGGVSGKGKSQAQVMYGEDGTGAKKEA